MDRTASCTDAFRLESALSAMPRPANATTKPDTTNKGRSRSWRSSEVPSSTGSKGSTQGDAMVSMPASKAMGVLIRSMGVVLWKEAPLHPRHVSGLCRIGGISQARVSAARAYTVRHTSRASRRYKPFTPITRDPHETPPGRISAVAGRLQRRSRQALPMPTDLQHPPAPGSPAPGRALGTALDKIPVPERRAVAGMPSSLTKASADGSH
ncbi:hypothetical protein D3C71_1484070 [compost metagenome]